MTLQNELQNFLARLSFGVPMKRSPTFHEKRVRFFMIFFGALGVLLVVGVILLLSRSPFSSP